MELPRDLDAFHAILKRRIRDQSEIEDCRQDFSAEIKVAAQRTIAARIVFFIGSRSGELETSTLQLWGPETSGSSTRGEMQNASVFTQKIRSQLSSQLKRHPSRRKPAFTTPRVEFGLSNGMLNSLA
ncbi:hypothetical protein V7S43_006854 [Phytophthora oleae]|uniref:Uncharacterized protein n=1 Tax=Phytophthora oleae TaxID=2107226 RepID=A0ABD3FMM5_9STRA